MPSLTNLPRETTMLRWARAKSAALQLVFQGNTGEGIDITDSELVFTVGKMQGRRKETGVVLAQPLTLDYPELGYADLDVQASQLDLPYGNYYFDITMTLEGFSAVVVTGELQLVPNTEYDAVDDTFSETHTPHQLILKMQGRQVIRVTSVIPQVPGLRGVQGPVGPQGPPGQEGDTGWRDISSYLNVSDETVAARRFGPICSVVIFGDGDGQSLPGATLPEWAMPLSTVVIFSAQGSYVDGGWVLHAPLPAGIEGTFAVMYDIPSSLSAATGTFMVTSEFPELDEDFDSEFPEWPGATPA